MAKKKKKKEGYVGFFLKIGKQLFKILIFFQTKQINSKKLINLYF